MSKYEEMSYDELSAYMDSDVCEPMEWGAVTAEQERKSAVMIALVELAQELEEAGLVVVPEDLVTALMGAVDWDALGWMQAIEIFEPLLKAAGIAAPPLTREA